MGLTEASKDRPVVILSAVRLGSEAPLRVVVAPITHTAPEDPRASIAIPAAIAARLRLDDGPHWVRTDELNTFAWPGFDIRPIPSRSGPSSAVYGLIPPGLYSAVRQAVLTHGSGRGIGPIERD
ncbi:MAG: hypothetical protein GVY28_05190 [Alphaproteobacteria bacterium]|nr:hypothetical protein [Alphaproteobacteria bacterium]